MPDIIIWLQEAFLVLLGDEHPILQIGSIMASKIVLSGQASGDGINFGNRSLFPRFSGDLSLINGVISATGAAN